MKPACLPQNVIEIWRRQPYDGPRSEDGAVAWNPGWKQGMATSRLLVPSSICPSDRRVSCSVVVVVAVATAGWGKSKVGPGAVAAAAGAALLLLPSSACALTHSIPACAGWRPYLACLMRDAFLLALPSFLPPFLPSFLPSIDAPMKPFRKRKEGGSRRGRTGFQTANCKTCPQQ